ncbi:MFS transporter [Limnoglobus roseus]|uniref:MFS transporter n=1 Tax=Limnoglobus roseus TaxID=2598579 RepID=A0A5C1ALG2_9BACT|nr:MFS transporter [Limnoglobus roseus]QEL20071.1 MFS transporter [Limnoglobus roseus]
MDVVEGTAPQKPVAGRQTGLLLLLAAINFTHILDFVIVMPLGDQLRHDLAITPQQFGFIVSAYGLAAVVAGILASTVVDRFDRKTVLLVAFAGFIFATLYCGLAADYAHLLLARALAGLFGGVAASGIMAIIGDVFPDKQRGKAIGAVTSSFAVASIIGLPIGLSLANWFHNWGAPFLAIAGLGTVVWAVAAWRLPSLTHHRAGQHAHPIAQFAAVLRQPNHLWSFAFMLAMVFGTFIIVPYFAPYFQANCGRSKEDLPIIYAVAGVGSLVMMNLIGWLTDRFGAQGVFLATAGGAVVMTLVITNLPPVSLAGAVATATLFMVLASGRVVPAQTMMLRSADPKLRGAFTNLNTAVSHFATGTGPVIAGLIIGEEYQGGPLTYYWLAGLVAAAFGIAALVLSFLLRPAAAPQPQTVPANPFPMALDPEPLPEAEEVATP